MLHAYVYTNTLLHEGYESNLEFMTKIFGKNIQALNLYSSIYFFLPFHVYKLSMGFIIMPEFLKTGLAKIRPHSTTWQLKTTRFVQRPIKKPISDAGQ